MTYFYYYENVINCFHSWLSGDPNLCSWDMVTDSWFQNEIFLVDFEDKSCGSLSTVIYLIFKILCAREYSFHYVGKTDP